MERHSGASPRNSDHCPAETATLEKGKRNTYRHIGQDEEPLPMRSQYIYVCIRQWPRASPRAETEKQRRASLPFYSTLCKASIRSELLWSDDTQTHSLSIPEASREG